MCGARPSGCRLARKTLSSGWISSAGSRHQRQDRGVVCHQGPMAIDGQGRVSSCPASTWSWPYERPGTPGRRAAAREDGGITGRDQGHIALAQGDGELFGQVEQHLTAGLRAARLDKTQVAGGDVGIESEV